MKYFQLLCKALLNREEKNHFQWYRSRISGRAECVFESKGKTLCYGEKENRSQDTFSLSLRAQEKPENGHMCLKFLKHTGHLPQLSESPTAGRRFQCLRAGDPTGWKALGPGTWRPPSSLLRVPQLPCWGAMAPVPSQLPACSVYA